MKPKTLHINGKYINETTRMPLTPSIHTTDNLHSSTRNLGIFSRRRRIVAMLNRPAT